jgi:hypothetical protein
MQLVRSQMRVPSRHRQTLMLQQVCNIFQRSAFHSQTARKCMSQVVPAKVLDPRCTHRVVEPMPPILERLAVFADRNTRPLPSPRSCTTLRAAIAASFNGTCMGSSFFVRGTFNIRPLKSTMSHVRLYEVIEGEFEITLDGEGKSLIPDRAA